MNNVRQFRLVLKGDNNGSQRGFLSIRDYKNQWRNLSLFEVKPLSHQTAMQKRVVVQTPSRGVCFEHAQMRGRRVSF